MQKVVGWFFRQDIANVEVRFSFRALEAIRKPEQLNLSVSICK